MRFRKAFIIAGLSLTSAFMAVPAMASEPGNIETEEATETEDIQEDDAGIEEEVIEEDTGDLDSGEALGSRQQEPEALMEKVDTGWDAGKPVWKTEPNGKTFYIVGGKALKGWQTINGFTYYFGKDGAQRTGWQNIDGSGYYFFPKTSGKNYKGTMARNWQTIGGKTYFFGADGKVRTFWQTINGFRYYFGSNGAQRTGWQSIDGNKYYFFPKTSGNSYMGTMAKNWRTISGKTYYFGNNGKMRTLWQTINGFRYYFGTDGAERTGFHTIGGKRYYFYDGSKAMREYEPNLGRALYKGIVPDQGFISIGSSNSIYYIQKDGSLATGKVRIEKDTYTFDKNGLLK